MHHAIMDEHLSYNKCYVANILQGNEAAVALGCHSVLIAHRMRWHGNISTKHSGRPTAKGVDVFITQPARTGHICGPAGV